MIWPFKSFFNKNKKMRTFTYYIPAPPSRRNGYQEKEFDKIMTELITKGFNIEDIKLQAHTGENASGMWIFCQLSTDDHKLEVSFNDEVHDHLQDESSDLHKENFNGLSLHSPTPNSSPVKEVELPEISEEEAREQLENLYPIEDDQENKI